MDSPTRISSTCLFQNRICLRFSSQEWKNFNGSVEDFICVLQFHHRFNTEYDRSTEAVDTGISEAIYHFSFGHSGTKIQWKLLVANASLGLAQIFCEIAPFRFQRKLIQSQNVCMSRSVLDPSWPQCRTLGFWFWANCPFAYDAQEPILLSREVSGRFHTTWQHQTTMWI